MTTRIPCRPGAWGSGGNCMSHGGLELDVNGHCAEGRRAYPVLVPPPSQSVATVPRAHTCHAKGCSVVVPEKMLMCRRHWRMVPVALQRAVWDAYVPGQEKRKDPTRRYLDAAHAAIDAVAKKERGVAAKNAQTKLPFGSS